ncbi:MAG: TlpA family protein disulfide reductase [Chthonomonadales bacterium]|nr:TlpA family protein disulfide reductase [Chthonomonadales bacterium]
MAGVRAIALGLLMAAALGGAPTACAAATADPEGVLKQITGLREARLAEARSGGRPFDADAVRKEAAALASSAVEGVDARSVAPAESMTWARLFSEAGRPRETADLAARYLETGPEPTARFEAQMLRLDALADQGDGKRIAVLLPTVTAPDPAAGGLLVSRVTRRYAPILARAAGLPETLRILERVERGIPRDDPSRAARERLDAEKERRRKLNQPPVQNEAEQIATFERQVRGSWAIRGYFFAQARADLLAAAGRKADAVRVLDAFTSGLGPDDAVARRAAGSARRILTLPGTETPELPALDTIGTYQGMRALRGKVVVLDFFAHWCGPCVASIPDMRKLYDDLQGRGLALLGVTEYQGWYGTEGRAKRDMPKAVERERMRAFAGEHGVTWPIVFVERPVSEAFGVQAIPHVVVIDRAGKVRSMDVGYSPESFARFRAEIEGLLRG